MTWNRNRRTCRGTTAVSAIEEVQGEEGVVAVIAVAIAAAEAVIVVVWLSLMLFGSYQSRLQDTQGGLVNTFLMTPLFKECSGVLVWAMLSLSISWIFLLEAWSTPLLSTTSNSTSYN